MLFRWLDQSWKVWPCAWNQQTRLHLHGAVRAALATLVHLVEPAAQHQLPWRPNLSLPPPCTPDFMARPHQAVTLNVPLHRPGAEGKKVKNRAPSARVSESQGAMRTIRRVASLECPGTGRGIIFCPLQMAPQQASGCYVSL